ncbi:MAG: hemerythrin domain-containing protein [Candidatus Binatia bacterium]
MKVVSMLSTQHREVLARLAAVEAMFDAGGRSEGVPAFLAFLEHEVGEHFTIEEEALFPVLARHLGETHGPLAVMRAEHAQFRELATALRNALDAADVDGQHAHGRALIELLRAHIAKEDNVLFPMASRLLSPEEQREVDARARRHEP